MEDLYKEIRTLFGCCRHGAGVTATRRCLCVQLADKRKVADKSMSTDKKRPSSRSGKKVTAK